MMDEKIPESLSEIEGQAESDAAAGQNVTLFDDAFSDKLNGSRKRFSLWWVFLLLIAVGTAVSYYSRPGIEEKMSELQQAPKRSALSGTVEKVRTRTRTVETEGDETDQPESESGPISSGKASEAVAPSPGLQDSENPPKREEVTRDKGPSFQEASVGPERNKIEQLPQKEAVGRNLAVEASGSVPEREEVISLNLPSEQVVKEPNVQTAAKSGSPISGETRPPTTEQLPGQEAYDQLVKNSKVAQRLVEGKYSTLEFLRWRMVQENPSETWIDLVGRWSGGGEEVHLIWAVNRQNGNLRALSQAARNLGADGESELE